MIQPPKYNVVHYCGLRRGEALALRVVDVDLTEDTLMVSQSLDLKVTDKKVRGTKKENGKRWLDIFEPLHDALSEYLPLVDGDILFPALSGGYMTDSGYRRFYESIMKELNMVQGGK